MKNFEHQLKDNSEESFSETEQLIKKNSAQDEKNPPKSLVGVMKGYKEKVADFLRYRKLKIKEYSGKLSQNEFDELLSSDFQDQLYDISPIREVFSAQQELAKIRKSSKHEKGELLSVFREKLATQREVLASCRVFIERSIEYNHDVPRKNLAEIIENFAREYGFTDEQKQIAQQLIDGYYENRQKVVEMRERFPKDTDLIYKLTGVQFLETDKIDVSVGPMTIDIDAEGVNTGRIHEQSNSPVMNFEYGGFASQSRGDNPVYYIVINHDKQMRKQFYRDMSGMKTRQHEYEHQKNKLFRALFEHRSSEQERSDLWRNYENEYDEKYKRIFLENFFHAERELALEQVKDEITATLRDRPLSHLRQQIDWMFLQRGAVYDYLGYLRDYKVKKDDPLYQEISQKMLVKEYGVFIEKAVNAFADLMNKGGYPIEEAIALLTDKSLPHWPKTVQRLLENKEK